jgi:hypothetical protein
MISERILGGGDEVGADPEEVMAFSCGGEISIMAIAPGAWASCDLARDASLGPGPFSLGRGTGV